MSQSLKCPSCGAPLEIENEFAAFIECEFCGVASRAADPGAAHGFEMNFGGAGLLEQARKLKEIKRLALAGSTINAVKVYRETFGVGLAEAKTAVDNLAAGRPVVFTSVQTFTTQNAFGETVGQALKLAQIQAALAGGNKILAIRIYRETFGVGLAEAKAAVEAMERGGSVELPNDLRINSTFGAGRAGYKTSSGVPALVKALLVILLAGALAALLVFRFLV